MSNDDSLGPVVTGLENYSLLVEHRHVCVVATHLLVLYSHDGVHFGYLCLPNRSFVPLSLSSVLTLRLIGYRNTSEVNEACFPWNSLVRMANVTFAFGHVAKVGPCCDRWPPCGGPRLLVWQTKSKCMERTSLLHSRVQPKIEDED